VRIIDYKPEQVNDDNKDENKLNRLSEKIDKLAIDIEKMGIAEYVAMLRSPRRLLFINFLSGLARGFGMAIGFTVLAALVLYLLQKIVVLNMPVIGNFIADIVSIVQNELSIGGSIFQSHGGTI